jgi:hypothetical protein
VERQCESQERRMLARMDKMDAKMAKAAKQEDILARIKDEDRQAKQELLARMDECI